MPLKQASPRERLIPALTLGAIGVAGNIILMAIPYGFFVILWAIPAFLVFWMALAVWSTRRGPGAATAMIVIPLTVIALMSLPSPSKSLSRWAADALDVAAYRDELLRQMNTRRSDGAARRIAVLPLAGFGSLTSGLAYDPSRNLDHPLLATDPQWRAAFEATELALPYSNVRHVLGPYYSWFHD